MLGSWDLVHDRILDLGDLDLIHQLIPEVMVAVVSRLQLVLGTHVFGDESPVDRDLLCTWVVLHLGVKSH